MKKLVLFLFLVPFVFGVSFEDAEQAFNNASLDLKLLKLNNLPSDSVEDALFDMQGKLYGLNISELSERARILNASGEPEKMAVASDYYLLISASKISNITPGANYSYVVEKAAWVHLQVESAFLAFDELSRVQNYILSFNNSLNLSRVDIVVSEAVSAFNTEHFSEVSVILSKVDDLIEQAQVDAARERAFYLLSRRNLVDYVVDHWFGVLLSLLVLSALGVWLFFESRLFLAVQKVKRLSAELIANEKSQRQAQIDYYHNGLGSGAYRSRMEFFKRAQRQLKVDLQLWSSHVKAFRSRSLLSRFGLFKQ